MGHQGSRFRSDIRVSVVLWKTGCCFQWESWELLCLCPRRYPQSVPVLFVPSLETMYQASAQHVPNQATRSSPNPPRSDKTKCLKVSGSPVPPQNWLAQWQPGLVPQGAGSLLQWPCVRVVLISHLLWLDKDIQALSNSSPGLRPRLRVQPTAGPPCLHDLRWAAFQK